MRIVAIGWELCKMRWIPYKKNETYELVQLPKGRKSLKNKWVLKWLRDTVEGNVVKLKKINTNKNASNMLTKVIPK